MRYGIFGAMVLSRANGYLLPDENEHFVYADTRIADPRYARSAEALVCVMDKGPDTFNPLATGGKGPKERGPKGDQRIPIGCCPAGDPSGKPYGPGMNCCCGQVYDEDASMCCDYSCKVYPNTLQGITRCNMDSVEVTTPAVWRDETKTIAEPTHNPPYWIPDPPVPSEDPMVPAVIEAGKCPKAWYVPSPMEASCTDYNNEGSFCAFTCPSNLKVRIPDDPNRVCHKQEWLGQVPQCCERDGCPSDLRVDFFFILDSSSSIKDKNFQYVREYVIGLISTMPVGLDKTRVGILTYNNDVIHRVRLNQFDKKSELMAAVNDIPYEGRGTKTNAALEYAVDEALTLENGDRPDVPNFVLVLTDGRATDDVRVGAPRLREKAAVIAVGVGKRIEKKELEHIAGDKGNVFMVADFRSLAPALQSDGNSICAEALIAAQKEAEDSENDDERKRRSEDGEAEKSVEQKLIDVQNETLQLGIKHENGEIPDATYYAELRRLGLQKTFYEQQGQQENQAEFISGETQKQKNKPNKTEQTLSDLTSEELAERCPGLKSYLDDKKPKPEGVGRFTTSFICPKSCIWDEYVLYYPDDLLTNF